MLGILYGIYGKDRIALSHSIEGHNLARQIEKNKGKTTPSISSYLDVAVRFIEMGFYKEALNYLDSCYLVNESGNRLHYIDVNYVQVYLKKGNTIKAKEYLNGVIPYFEDVGTEYLPTVLSIAADLKLTTNEKYSAIYYYENSLKAIETYRTNVKLKPIILTNLSELYSEKGFHRLSYHYLKSSKNISDSWFNSQSQQNKSLFEIKNRY